MNQDNMLSDEKFNAAYLIMAAIITKYGDKYLPIFKRLHEEKLQRQANEDLKVVALKALADTTDID